tara:strand:+ start:1190 stop:1486 length:297 start_codon:yes stop_codon:yes gene_type:complete
MEEENKTEETKEEETKEEGEEEKSSPDSPMAKAMVIRDDIRKDIEEYKELKNYVEGEKVKEILSGRTDAGSEAPKVIEETPLEYSRRIMNNELKDGEG